VGTDIRAKGGGFDPPHDIVSDHRVGRFRRDRKDQLDLADVGGEADATTHGASIALLARMPKRSAAALAIPRRLVPFTTISTCRPSHREHSSRSRQRGCGLAVLQCWEGEGPVPASGCKRPDRAAHAPGLTNPPTATQGGRQQEIRWCALSATGPRWGILLAGYEPVPHLRPTLVC
jgi:hypothetical protein